MWLSGSGQGSMSKRLNGTASSTASWVTSDFTSGTTLRSSACKVLPTCLATAPPSPSLNAKKISNRHPNGLSPVWIVLFVHKFVQGLNIRLWQIECYQSHSHSSSSKARCVKSLGHHLGLYRIILIIKYVLIMEVNTFINNVFSYVSVQSCLCKKKAFRNLYVFLAGLKPCCVLNDFWFDRGAVGNWTET